MFRHSNHVVSWSRTLILVAVAIALGCGAAPTPTPTPNPWIDLLHRMEALDRLYGSAMSEAGMIDQLVTAHGRPKCVEALSVAGETLPELAENRRELKKNIEFGWHVAAGDRDPETFEYLALTTGAYEEYVTSMRELFFDMSHYGEANKCWPP